MGRDADHQPERMDSPLESREVRLRGLHAGVVLPSPGR